MAEELLVRTGQCAGCAFAPGSPANQSPLTMFKARLCVLTGEPFFCHYNCRADGTPIPGTGPRLLCRGFVDAVQNRLDHETRDCLSEWKRALLLELNDAVVEIERRPDLTEEQVIAMIQKIVEEVIEKVRAD